MKKNQPKKVAQKKSASDKKSGSNKTAKVRKNAAPKAKPKAASKAKPKKKAEPKNPVAKKVATKKAVLAKKPAAKKLTAAKKPTSNKFIAKKTANTKPIEKKIHQSVSMPEELRYKSILDTPEVETEPAYRYSDEELNDFKAIIISKIDTARKEVGYLQGLIQDKSDGGSTSRNGDINGSDLAVSAMEKEQLTQLASRQLQFINHLEKALIRIENKTYGVCRVTGKLIDKARLRAVPHATLCVQAKQNMSREKV